MGNIGNFFLNEVKRKEDFYNYQLKLKRDRIYIIDDPDSKNTEQLLSIVERIFINIEHNGEYIVEEEISTETMDDRIIRHLRTDNLKVEYTKRVFTLRELLIYYLVERIMTYKIIKKNSKRRKLLNDKRKKRAKYYKISNNLKHSPGYSHSKMPTKNIIREYLNTTIYENIEQKIGVKSLINKLVNIL